MLRMLKELKEDGEKLKKQTKAMWGQHGNINEEIENLKK